MGADHPSVADALTRLATVLEAQGAHEAARSHGERALAIEEKALGPEHPLVANPLTALGNTYRELGRLEDAIGADERAVRIREANPGDPTLLADSRFALAKALWAARRGRPRAIELGKQARDTSVRAGDATWARLGEAESWLAGLGVE